MANLSVCYRKGSLIKNEIVGAGFCLANGLQETKGGSYG